ncbi:hypothetical protein VKI21_06825 [Cyanobacterium aponinum UTEX 3222]|uniref:hypothetical protein n=1 Tax=Cyanobacterium aponinum TaxID=379064 RepID=UPI0030882C70|nr:hypothetical protein VKI21_06825 [Cyanobacterium aponinum UTEX 3222]
MPKYFVEYTTDDGKSTTIRVDYAENGDQRLSKGGLSQISSGCRNAMPRKFLKPRFVDTFDDGRIIFKTHASWLNFISSNTDKIKKLCGECLSACAVSQLY